MKKETQRLLIFGAGGHGKVCADIAEQMGLWDEIVFADDHPMQGFPYSIIGDSRIEWSLDCFVAIGNNSIRKRVSIGRKLVTLIHPNAVVAKSAIVGCGTMIAAGAVINPFAKIGENVIINTSASVDHDCVVKNNVHISVGVRVCGTVTIGENTWIGAGATIKNNTQICDNCIIGAGAVVVKDITEPGTYVGVPAKRINEV